MKRCVALISLFLFLTIFFGDCIRQKDNFSLLKGPYLGQKPPGIIPEIFAQGIISTGASEFGSTFTPDGQEFCYAVSGVPRQVIVCIKSQASRWTQPQIPVFSGRYDDWDMNFSPDGKKLYFTSNRPFTGKGDPLDNSNLWVVEKTKTILDELPLDGDHQLVELYKQVAVPRQSREGKLSPVDHLRSLLIRLSENWQRVGDMAARTVVLAGRSGGATKESPPGAFGEAGEPDERL